jgi:hypothetical protein
VRETHPFRATTRIYAVSALGTFLIREAGRAWRLLGMLEETGKGLIRRPSLGAKGSNDVIDKSVGQFRAGSIGW